MGLNFGKDIGIDLGTANVLVTIPRIGIVYKEASAIAIDTRKNEVLAIGNKAKEMIGRTPDYINAIRPLKDGVIADFTATKLMLKEILKKIFRRYNIIKPNIVVGIPNLITEVEKRAVEEALYGSGAEKVLLVEETVASAIGSGIRIEEAKGKMIVDIGGGTTEIAVLSLGGIVTCESLRVAGDKIDFDIIKYIRRKYNVDIGPVTAEVLKQNLGCAMPLMSEKVMTIKGRDLGTGYPVSVEVSSDEMEIAMKHCINQIVDEIKNVLEKTPPEIVSDIVETGIMISGGGALIRDIDKYITEKTGVHVSISPNPLESVVIGTNMIVENLNNFKNVYEGMRLNEQK